MINRRALILGAGALALAAPAVAVPVLSSTPQHLTMMTYIGAYDLPPMDIRVGDVYFDTYAEQFWACTDDKADVDVPRGKRVVYSRTFQPVTDRIKDIHYDRHALAGDKIKVDVACRLDDALLD